MTAIERTAYPCFKPQPTPKELTELYTPTTEEMAFAQAQVASKAGLFRLLILLKAFQRLGYFPPSACIPVPVISHLRSWLKLPAQVSPLAPLRTLHRYQQAIRSYLRVNAYNQSAQQVATAAITKAAQVMDHPADLIMLRSRS
jgi:hypothetical protein